MKKVFSVDCESNGLWGEIFSVAAVVTDENGNILDSFVGQSPIEGVVNEWVLQNVIPLLKDVPQYESYRSLLKSFSDFYMKYRSESDVDFVTHMGYIVESKLLRDMKEFGFIGEWDAPYPLFDVSGHLEMVGEDPTSVDKYNAKYNVKVGVEGGTHNPLYDAAAAAAAYIHLLKRAKRLCQQVE